MNAELSQIIEDTKQNMTKTISHFSETLVKVHAGKASPTMISDVFVDYYGARTPLSQVGSISSPDAKSIIIHPWDKSMIIPIEKAIQAANLGFNPHNDGEIIRIIVPPLTEERRKQLVKYVHQEGENNKVSIRNARKKANEDIKLVEKKGASEDEARKAEEKIQEMTAKNIKDIDDLIAKKEKEIMTV